MAFGSIVINMAVLTASFPSHAVASFLLSHLRALWWNSNLVWARFLAWFPSINSFEHVQTQYLDRYNWMHSSSSFQYSLHVRFEDWKRNTKILEDESENISACCSRHVEWVLRVFRYQCRWGISVPCHRCFWLNQLLGNLRVVIPPWFCRLKCLKLEFWDLNIRVSSL